MLSEDHMTVMPFKTKDFTLPPFCSLPTGTYHCIFRYKNSYSVATKDVTVHPLPLESDIMMDPLEASGLCTSSHQFKCCVEKEEGEEYSVTFHVDSLSFPAGKRQATPLLGPISSQKWGFILKIDIEKFPEMEPHLLSRNAIPGYSGNWYRWIHVLGLPEQHREFKANLGT